MSQGQRPTAGKPDRAGDSAAGDGRRYRIKLGAIEVVDCTDGAERPFWDLGPQQWHDAPIETVLVIQRRLLDLAESMAQLGLDVNEFRKGTGDLDQILKKHLTRAPAGGIR